MRQLVSTTRFNLIDKENIVTFKHFDSGGTFYSEHVTWEQNVFSKLCENSVNILSITQRSFYPRWEMYL